MNVGIVGAGIAGLACADQLARAGIAATLLDKGKRPGGRLSSVAFDGLAWDIGAQYFTPRDDRFAAAAQQWQRQGLVAHWPAAGEGALIATPAMAALVAAQCAAHDVRFGMQVQLVERGIAGWFLSGPGFCEGPFDAVAIAVPAEQAAPLLALHDLDLAGEAAAVRSMPCWTLMAAFDSPVADVPDVLRDRGAIAWAARDNAKPGRGDAECWVIQASAEWSLANLERDAGDIAPAMLALFAHEAGSGIPEATFAKAHRWRFAFPFGQRGQPLWNARLALGACGDWCGAGMIEGAWLSGTDLGRTIVQALGDTTGYSSPEPITPRRATG